MKRRPLLDAESPMLWDGDPAGRRATARFAGILFAAAGVTALPVCRLIHDPTPPATVYLVPLVALLSGLVCVLVRWERLHPSLFHLIPAIGTAEVALSVWALGPHGRVMAWFYVFVAVFAGLAFRSRLAVAAHVGLASVALAAPVMYTTVDGQDDLLRTLVALPTLAAAAAVVMLLRERLEAGQEALRDLADRDPLTGVGNYRALYERLDHEIARHARHEREFAVTLIDLDRFKQVNELYGHLEGDRLLRDVGRALMLTVRGTDTVARQGGDEFSVLAPESSAAEAATLAERLERALGRICVGDGQLTASVGCAVYPGDGTSPEALMAAADTAMRANKHERRSAAPAEDLELAY